MMYGQQYPYGYPGAAAPHPGMMLPGPPQQLAYGQPMQGFVQPMQGYGQQPQAPQQQQRQQQQEQQPAARNVGRSLDANNGLLSVVIKREDMEHWYNCAYLIPHEPIRQWCLDIETYVVNNDTFDPIAYPWKMHNFFEWYNEYFYEVVVHHHGVEEKIVNPWLATKGIQTPVKMEADHDTLHKYLDGVKDFEAQYRALNRPAAWAPDQEANIQKVIADLRKHLGELCKLMGPHLAEEEKFYPGEFRDKLTLAEWKKKEGEIVKSLGLKGASQTLPHFITCMKRWNPAMVPGFLAEVPPPIRYMLNNKWLPKYHGYVRPLLEGLVNDRPPPEYQESGCCSIC